MTFDFFEGAAGTGKTHNLVGRARELVMDRVLGEERKVLALTFMNGARRRLEARLGGEIAFRKRFACQTFDVFARTVSARRRSLITPTLQEQATALGEFNGPCFLAGEFLENNAVSQWIAQTFPLILVDEAQDLDNHRMRILQGLSQSCRIIAAADAFQCLHDGYDTAPLIGWLEGVGQTHRLTHPRRTNQQGLLAAALAVRQGRSITEVLRQSQRARRATWFGDGFRLVETFATNPGIVARSIADEISYRTGAVTILSPDMTSRFIRDTLDVVHTRVWQRNNLDFGPFPLTYERQEHEEADALLAGITLPETASYANLCTFLLPLNGHAPIAQAISRMNRLRRVHGQTDFTATQVTEFVRESIRHRSRLGFRQQRGHLAMTIQRAKNREFQNVIVLWPHTATGSPEHLRRLLYNGITRAQSHCTVIVLGQNRLNAPPFI